MKLKEKISIGLCLVLMVTIVLSPLIFITIAKGFYGFCVGLFVYIATFGGLFVLPIYIISSKDKEVYVGGCARRSRRIDKCKSRGFVAKRRRTINKRY